MLKKVLMSRTFYTLLTLGLFLIGVVGCHVDAGVNP